MKRIMINTGTLVVFLFQSLAPAQAQDLFRYVDPNSVGMTQRQSELLTTIRNRPTSIDVHLVRINDLSSLSDRQSLSLNFPTEFRESSINYINRPREGAFSWFGSIGNGEGNVRLTVVGSDASGMFHIGSAIYTLEPLGQGLLALIHLDQSKFPPDEPPNAYSTTKAKKIGPKSDGTLSPSPSLLKENQATAAPTPVTIYVLVVYTDLADALSGPMDVVIAGFIDELDDIRVKSFHSKKVELAYSYRVSGYMETGNSRTDVERLWGTDDGFMDDVHAIRDQKGADLVVLVVGTIADACGEAFGIEVGASDAFAVVMLACAQGNYSFAHEVGHLIGGRHDVLFDDTPSFAHGYKLVGINNKTIMSIKANEDNRIPYWSSDDSVTINSQKYVLGNNLTNNVRKKWIDRAKDVKNFRPPPPLSVNISGPTTAQCVTTTYNANLSFGTWPYTYQWSQKTECSGPANQLCGTYVPVGTNSSELDIFLCTSTSTLKVKVTDGLENEAEDELVVYGDGGGGGGGFPPPSVTSEIATIELASAPVEYSLSQNRPNPFNPETRIGFALPEDGFTKLIIYDLRGGEVARLINEEYSAGYHSVIWDGSSVASGIYYYRLTSGDFVQTKKMVLLK